MIDRISYGPNTKTIFEAAVEPPPRAAPTTSAERRTIRGRARRAATDFLVWLGLDQRRPRTQQTVAHSPGNHSAVRTFAAGVIVGSAILACGSWLAQLHQKPSLYILSCQPHTSNPSDSGPGTVNAGLRQPLLRAVPAVIRQGEAPIGAGRSRIPGDEPPPWIEGVGSNMPGAEVGHNAVKGE